MHYPFQRRRQQPHPQAMRRNATKNSSAPTGKMAAMRIPDPRAMPKMPRRHPPPFPRNIPVTLPSPCPSISAGTGRWNRERGNFLPWTRKGCRSSSLRPFPANRTDLRPPAAEPSLRVHRLRDVVQPDLELLRRLQGGIFRLADQDGLPSRGASARAAW